MKMISPNIKQQYRDIIQKARSAGCIHKGVAMHLYSLNRNGLIKSADIYNTFNVDAIFEVQIFIEEKVDEKYLYGKSDQLYESTSTDGREILYKFFNYHVRTK